MATRSYVKDADGNINQIDETETYDDGSSKSSRFEYDGWTGRGRHVRTIHTDTNGNQWDKDEAPGSQYKGNDGRNR